jgi:S-adenosylmethionine:tRNA ribosyltransferase-isomerase
MQNIPVFDFELPSELIAQVPASPRDSARLLVYKMTTGEIIDTVFSDIGRYLHPNTTIVVNNTKVEQCRWMFGKTEIFVVEKCDPTTVRAMVRPGKRFRLGDIFIHGDFQAKVTAIDDYGIRTLQLNQTHNSKLITQFLHTPLPPYIAQDDSLESEYQTVYAKSAGSLAAPTAGLHFTDSLLAELKKQHQFLEVDLTVGLGTFAKLTDDNFASGKLHAEQYAVAKTVSEQIKVAQHITAVGTTTTRTLETLASDYSRLSGATDIFITPGYNFARVDSMITNFHLPSTSLLLMVEAFVQSRTGKPARTELEMIYNHAIANKYRFYSFGDAMLLV